MKQDGQDKRKKDRKLNVKTVDQPLLIPGSEQMKLFAEIVVIFQRRRSRINGRFCTNC